MIIIELLAIIEFSMIIIEFTQLLEFSLFPLPRFTESEEGHS